MLLAPELSVVRGAGTCFLTPLGLALMSHQCWLGSNQSGRARVDAPAWPDAVCPTHTCSIPVPQASPAGHASTQRSREVFPSNARVQHEQDAVEGCFIADLEAAWTTFGRRAKIGISGWSCLHSSLPAGRLDINHQAYPMEWTPLLYRSTVVALPRRWLSPRELAPLNLRTRPIAYLRDRRRTVHMTRHTETIEQPSWLSSAMQSRIPYRAMFGYGVEHRQQLAHSGDEGDLLALAGSQQALVAGLERRVVAVAMYKVLRTSEHPPQMQRCPRIWPESRFKGATPTSAAMRRRSSLPSSGNSASNTATLAAPMPGTLVSAWANWA
ncbi:hypothetical protein SAMN04489710_101526 [Paracidovorax konjaci]|uniref:Uncharacterized protein n=1 Tax=Paracidovorax konjaci TaxID=32040 RepID=A0A1I1S092_9BURK|nr:hypothetical protein SAMN04489710_101526 [Paracidovorax konjaci]